MALMAGASLLHRISWQCDSFQRVTDSGLSFCGIRNCKRRSWGGRRTLSVVRSGVGGCSMAEPDVGCSGSCKTMRTKIEDEIVAVGRRGVVLSMLFVNFSANMGRAAEIPDADSTASVPLELFSDAKDGFSMLRPAVWNKVDKPGATVFFEDPQTRGNNIGVTVNPVRIASLKVFGTVDDVTEKLIQAERDKPSTKGMHVIRVQERQLLKDTPLYQLEYTLDTSRGSKRVLTAVTVSAFKLYILSIVYVDGSKSPAPVDVDRALHKVLESFDLLA